MYRSKERRVFLYPVDSDMAVVALRINRTSRHHPGTVFVFTISRYFSRTEHLDSLAHTLLAKRGTKRCAKIGIAIVTLTRVKTPSADGMRNSLARGDRRGLCRRSFILLLFSRKSIMTVLTRRTIWFVNRENFDTILHAVVRDLAYNCEKLILWFHHKI